MKDLERRVKEIERKSRKAAHDDGSVLYRETDQGHEVYSKSNAGFFTVEYVDGRAEVIRIDWPYGGWIYVYQDGRVLVCEDRPFSDETFLLPFQLVPGCSLWRKLHGVIKGL